MISLKFFWNYWITVTLSVMNHTNFPWNGNSEKFKWIISNMFWEIKSVERYVGFGKFSFLQFTTTLISRKIAKVQSSHVLYSNTVWKNEKFTVTQKNSSNQLFSVFFSKTVTFTKFLSKKFDSKFPRFPHCE